MARFRGALVSISALAFLAPGTVGTGQALAAPVPLGSATASTAASAVRPPSTRVRGIDVDASTIPQLERLMRAHRLSSADLVRFYVARIHALNPKLLAVIRVSSTALADARA